MYKRLAEVLTCVHGGDHDAREEILKFLQARFLKLAKLRVMGEDAKDIVQETLMVVDHHLQEIATVEGLLAYTNEVMRNKIGNHYRRRDLRRRYIVTSDHVPEPEYDMTEELETAELYRLMHKAIDELGEVRPRCRELFLGLINGLSISDLCERLQMPRSKVDEWLFRCRQALRRILQKRHWIQ